MADPHCKKRWVVFARFPDDVRICLTNDAAERGLRGIALEPQVLAVRRVASRWAACRGHV